MGAAHGALRRGLTPGALLGIAYPPCRKESRAFRSLGIQRWLSLSPGSGSPALAPRLVPLSRQHFNRAERPRCISLGEQEPGSGNSCWEGKAPGQGRRRGRASCPAPPRDGCDGKRVAGRGAAQGGAGAAGWPAAPPGARTPPFSQEQGSLRLPPPARGCASSCGCVSHHLRPCWGGCKPLEASWGAPAPCPQPRRATPSPSFRARGGSAGVCTAQRGQLRAPTSQSLPPWGSSACRGLLGAFWGSPKGVAPTPHLENEGAAARKVLFSYGKRASELKAPVSHQPSEPA